jgi:hypothetical protein
MGPNGRAQEREPAAARATALDLLVSFSTYSEHIPLFGCLLQKALAETVPGF